MKGLIVGIIIGVIICLSFISTTEYFSEISVTEIVHYKSINKCRGVCDSFNQSFFAISEPIRNLRCYCYGDYNIPYQYLYQDAVDMNSAQWEQDA